LLELGEASEIPSARARVQGNGPAQAGVSRLIDVAHAASS
jgi:hypothetical protein